MFAEVHEATDQKAASLVGVSAAMREIRSQISLAASVPVNVLLRGETGTGKELVALAIHQSSPRSANRFVPVNCGAIPDTLLETELFGHERGAFTGAHARHAGYFEQANAGTLLLDEIGELPLHAQTRLLRVLQDRHVQRVGATNAVRIDTRVLAATNLDLQAAVQAGKFRQDLLYRLNVFTVWIPPLRERIEDIPYLVSFFIRRFSSDLGLQNSSVEPEAMDFLQKQLWPGNIRELENVVQNAALHAQGRSITLDDIKHAHAQNPPTPTNQDLKPAISALLEKAEQGLEENPYDRAIEIVEHELFAQAVQRTHGNQSEIARLLRIDRKTVHGKLTRFGLNQRPYMEALP